MSIINCCKKLLSYNRYLTHFHNPKFANLKIENIGSLKINNLNFYRFLSTDITNRNKQSIDPVTYLNLNYRDQRRIYKIDVISALKEIENKGLQNDGLFILQCCGNNIPDEIPTERISLAHQVWAILKNSNTKLGIEYYNTMLKCYIENQMIVSYKNFLDQMSCEPNEETYHLLLKCVCEQGDLIQAVDIVNIMKEKGLPANEPVFSALIYGHLKTGDINSVRNILSTMKIAHLSLSSLTYTELLRGYAELKDESKFSATLNEAVSNGNLNHQNVISIVKSICISENINLLPLIKKSFPNMVTSRSFLSNLTNLCIHLIYLKKPELAYEVYNNLIDPEIGFLSESDTYYSTLLYEMTKAKTEPNIVIKICDDLIQSKRNELALYKTVEYSLKILNTNLAISLLKNLHSKNEKLRNHYFWPLLVHAGQTTGQTGLFDLFQLMNELGVEIEKETLEFYSLKFIENLDPEIVVYKLKELNMTVKNILTPLSVVLLRKNRLKDVLNICLKYKIKLDGDSVIKPLTLSYFSNSDSKNVVEILKNITGKKTLAEYCGQMIILLLNKSSTNAHYEQIFNLLKELKNNNFKITSNSLDRITFLTDKIQNNNFKTNISQIAKKIVDYSHVNDQNNYIPHPRDMNLEQQECHLIELTNKKMETRGILRKLIQEHCKIGNLDRVQELLEEFERSNYKMSAGMKAGLLSVYLKSRDLKLAQKCYNKLIEDEPNFIVDEFKVIDLAELLISENNYNDAVELIKTESRKRKILGGKPIEHNCWRLLNTTALLGNSEHTKSLFELITNAGFCAPNNVILGPLIRVHLNSGNLKEAVDEYENCCIKYKETPLQHELLCKLVDKENSMDCIQKVLDATERVHGIKIAKMALTAALAETNKCKTLRELLMENSTDISTVLLEQHCNRWIKENNAAPLHTLLTSRNRFSQANQEVIYQSIMRIYSANDDLEGTLTLWDELQELDFASSENLRNLFKTVLRNHNHSLAAKI